MASRVRTFDALPPRGELLAALDEHLAVRVRRLLPEALCARWVEGVLAARAEWTADFGGEQYALGRAFYTHLETGRSEQYFRDAAASDARVERVAPGLQARMRELVEHATDARVVPRRGFCGPGIHVFPAGEKVARDGGVVHFDTEGLTARHLDLRKPAISAIAMLQPPLEGGGLRVWDVRWDGGDEPHAGDPRADDEVVEAFEEELSYGRGDVVLIEAYRLHQIRPFSGELPRISATVHAAELDPGLWEAWF